MAATVLFHLALLLVFLFTGLTIPLPFPPEELGIPVELALGNTDQGMGDFRPESTEATDIPLPETEPSPTEPASAEEVATQDESALSTPTTESEKPAEKPKELDPKLRNLISNNPFKTTQNQTGTGQGNTNEAGTFGAQNGSPTGNALSGGGTGNGTMASLGGRSAKNLNRIPGNWQEQGRIVVEVVVNRNGDVMRAAVGKGTTIANANLLRAAEAEAKKVKFTPSDDAPEEQRGKITYEIVLQ